MTQRPGQGPGTIRTKSKVRFACFIKIYFNFFSNTDIPVRMGIISIFALVSLMNIETIYD